MASSYWLFLNFFLKSEVSNWLHFRSKNIWQICSTADLWNNMWWFIEGDFPEYVIEMWYSDDDPHPLSDKRKDSTGTSWVIKFVKLAKDGCTDKCSLMMASRVVIQVVADDTRIFGICCGYEDTVGGALTSWLVRICCGVWTDRCWSMTHLRNLSWIWSDYIWSMMHGSSVPGAWLVFRIFHGYDQAIVGAWLIGRYVSFLPSFSPSCEGCKH